MAKSSNPQSPADSRGPAAWKATQSRLQENLATNPTVHVVVAVACVLLLVVLAFAGNRAQFDAMIQASVIVACLLFLRLLGGGYTPKKYRK